jgi:hypothetical protein
MTPLKPASSMRRTSGVSFAVLKSPAITTGVSSVYRAASESASFNWSSRSRSDPPALQVEIVDDQPGFRSVQFSDQGDAATRTALKNAPVRQIPFGTPESGLVLESNDANRADGERRQNGLRLKGGRLGFTLTQFLELRYGDVVVAQLTRERFGDVLAARSPGIDINFLEKANIGSLLLDRSGNLSQAEAALNIPGEQLEGGLQWVGCGQSRRAKCVAERGPRREPPRGIALQRPHSSDSWAV